MSGLSTHGPKIVRILDLYDQIFASMANLRALAHRSILNELFILMELMVRILYTYTSCSKGFSQFQYNCKDLFSKELKVR
ncbi:hypothetical protein XELAEV_18034658mg [Xenopus laevis]|uniref:Uncharacterized protein n=1 Tax=Xenopus laevis TaxID=8355 RepID=A0A974CEC9_XENLA|nr:hypothetical protein XELAEV_18034658mg [Xenopus laevis]